METKQNTALVVVVVVVVVVLVAKREPVQKQSEFRLLL